MKILEAVKNIEAKMKDQLGSRFICHYAGDEDGKIWYTVDYTTRNLFQITQRVALDSLKAFVEKNGGAHNIDTISIEKKIGFPIN